MNEEFKVLFSGILGIDYHQFYIDVDDDDDSEDYLSVENAFSEHTNGLCGSACSGKLFFTAGPDVGAIAIEIRLHGSPPTLDSNYTEIVEVPFTNSEAPVFLCEWAHEETHALDLPPGDYRVRYSIEGFDKDYDDVEEDDDEELKPIPGQKYLVQFWLQSHQPDEIIKKTSESAAYWHNSNRSS